MTARIAVLLHEHDGFESSEYMLRDIAAVWRENGIGVELIRGCPAHVDPEFVATALIAAADGIQIQWMSDPSIDMGEHMRRVWECLLR